MLPEQISPWHLESFLDVPRNLPLKFGQNLVSNRYNIPGNEFLWVVVLVYCNFHVTRNVNFC